MKYESRMEMKVNGKPVFAVIGGRQGNRCFLEFKQPAKKRSIRASWTMESVVQFGSRALPQGLPLTLSIDGKTPVTVHYRKGRLYPAKSKKPWTHRALKDWSDVFESLSAGAGAIPAFKPEPAMTATRDLEGYAGCVGSYASAGGGIGAAVGLVGGGPAGAGTGAAVGAAIGASFGVGACVDHLSDDSSNQSQNDDSSNNDDSSDDSEGSDDSGGDDN